MVTIFRHNLPTPNAHVATIALSFLAQRILRIRLSWNIFASIPHLSAANPLPRKRHTIYHERRQQDQAHRMLSFSTGVNIELSPGKETSNGSMED
jgi:hypothetical protein